MIRQKKAFVWTEELLKLMLLPLLLQFLTTVCLLYHHYRWPSVSQWSIFQRQWRQLLQRSSLLSCDRPLKISYHDEIFEIDVDDKKRLVKKPGYEILMTNIDLFDVDAFSESTCHIYVMHQGKEFFIEKDMAPSLTDDDRSVYFNFMSKIYS